MDWLLVYVLAFFSGAAVKAVDWIDDEEKGKSPLKWPLAVIYGLLLGYIISNASFSMIFLAALFAQLFARKVDTLAHGVGVAAAIITIAFLSPPPLEMSVFLFFTFMAFMDEIEYMGRLKPLSDYRPFLKIGALVPFLWGRFDYFLGIIIFDAGYELYRYAKERLR